MSAQPTAPRSAQSNGGVPVGSEADTHGLERLRAELRRIDKEAEAQLRELRGYGPNEAVTDKELTPNIKEEVRLERQAALDALAALIQAFPQGYLSSRALKKLFMAMFELVDGRQPSFFEPIDDHDPTRSKTPLDVTVARKRLVAVIEAYMKVKGFNLKQRKVAYDWAVDVIMADPGRSAAFKHVSAGTFKTWTKAYRAAVAQEVSWVYDSFVSGEEEPERALESLIRYAIRDATPYRNTGRRPNKPK